MPNVGRFFTAHGYITRPTSLRGPFSPVNSTFPFIFNIIWVSKLLGLIVFVCLTMLGMLAKRSGTHSCKSFRFNVISLTVLIILGWNAKIFYYVRVLYFFVFLLLRVDFHKLHLEKLVSFSLVHMPISWHIPLGTSTTIYIDIVPWPRVGQVKFRFFVG